MEIWNNILAKAWVRRGQKRANVLTNSLRSQFIKVSRGLPTVTAGLRKILKKSWSSLYIWMLGDVIVYNFRPVESFHTNCRFLQNLSELFCALYSPPHPSPRNGFEEKLPCSAAYILTLSHLHCHLTNKLLYWAHTHISVYEVERAVRHPPGEKIFSDCSAVCSHLQGCVAGNT